MKETAGFKNTRHTLEPLATRRDTLAVNVFKNVVESNNGFWKIIRISVLLDPRIRLSPGVQNSTTSHELNGYISDICSRLDF